MNTVNINAIGRDKYSSEDFNPIIGVTDNHLLVNQHPSVHGPYEADNDHLPSITAKSFRMTNATSNNILVEQKVLVFSRYFDEETVGIAPDSPTVRIDTNMQTTPFGDSQVVELSYEAGSSAYATVPVVPLSPELNYTVLFKIKSIQDDLQPLGVYTKKASIDINFPAAAIRIKPDLSIKARVGETEFEPASSADIQLNVWHRAIIRRVNSDFTIQVDRYEAGAFVSLVASGETYTSIGAGLLDEIDNLSTYVIGFASEGGGVQQIDSFEVFKANNFSETLIAGTTKEYFCTKSLDEFKVDGQVSGYYRS